MSSKVSKSEELNLTVNFEIEFDSYYSKDLTKYTEEFASVEDLCRNYCSLEHVFYNKIYDERYDLKSKHYYANEKSSPCNLILDKLFYSESIKKKMIEYAIFEAYSMVESDLEKEEQHEQQVKEWKKDLEEIDKKIYNTEKFAKTANKFHRLEKYRKKKSAIQKKIDTPYSSKRIFGTKEIKFRLDSILHRALNEKKAKKTKAAFNEEKKKNKYITWDKVKQKFSNVCLTEEERSEVLKEREILLEEFRQKRYGHFCSYGYAAEYGNRFFKLYKDENGETYILFCPDKKIHIKFRITNANGYDELLKTMFDRANICQVPLTYRLNLYKKEIHISYNPIILYGRELWEQIKPVPHRVASVDLNPDETGFVVADFYGKNGIKIIWAEVYSVKELNDEDRALDGSNIDSSDWRRLHIKNKRHYEIDVICKDIMKVVRHYHCEMFAIERLQFKSKKDRSRDFNKLVNKYWCRNRFYQNIQRECKKYKVEFKEVIASYSSFVGNFMFRSFDLPDMCLAALEIGRRAYRIKEVYKGKNKKDIPEDKREAIILPDAEDFRVFVTESMNEFRNRLLMKKTDFYEELDSDSKHLLKKLYNAIGTSMVRVRLSSLLSENDWRVHRSHTKKSKVKRIIFETKNSDACADSCAKETFQHVSA